MKFLDAGSFQPYSVTRWEKVGNCGGVACFEVSQNSRLMLKAALRCRPSSAIACRISATESL